MSNANELINELAAEEADRIAAYVSQDILRAVRAWRFKGVDERGQEHTYSIANMNMDEAYFTQCVADDLIRKLREIYFHPDAAPG